VRRFNYYPSSTSGIIGKDFGNSRRQLEAAFSRNRAFVRLAGEVSQRQPMAIRQTVYFCCTSSLSLFVIKKE
jgi:hypothetical protein